MLKPNPLEPELSPPSRNATAPSPAVAPRQRGVLATVREIARQLRHGIPADRYTREYFLSEHCDGLNEFLRERGLSYVKERLLEKVAPEQGESILEIGCGRGEVLNACAERGARAFGLDYAPDAVRLTRETCGARAAVLQGNATALPLATESLDKVLLGDVLEHLTVDQARRMIGEIHRVLRPEGTMILHTSPNVYFMHLLMPWLMLALLVAGRKSLVRLLAGQYQASWNYHVREYSLGRLERLFRESPFRDFEVSCDRDVLRAGRSQYTASLASNPLVRAIARLATSGPLLRLLANDLWVVGRKSVAASRGSRSRHG